MSNSWNPLINTSENNGFYDHKQLLIMYWNWLWHLCAVKYKIIYRSENPPEHGGTYSAYSFAFRGTPLPDISVVVELVESCIYVLIDCQASAPSCPPTQHAPAPKAAATITARTAFSTAPGGRLKWAGAMHANMATVTVRVNKMETAVLMATIWPNLAKGTMTQKKRGIVEITVVTALDTMATPTWFTASRVRLCLSAAGPCKHNAVY